MLDDAGRARKPICVPARAAVELLDHLSDLGADIVLVEKLRVDVGRDVRTRIWIAPLVLVDPIRRAAALSDRASAAMLARLPRIPALRSQLHRHAIDMKQLTLL